MKKILVITFITVIFGMIFTVLYMKATQIKSTTQPVTKVVAFPKITTKATDTAKASTKKADVSKAATKSDAERKADAANNKIITSSVLSQTDTWVKTLATVTPKNSTSIFEKLDAMGVIPYLTDEFKKSYSSETITNMSYNIIKISPESLKNNKTGKQDTCIVVNFNFNVKVTIGSITIPSRLFFAQNAKGEYKLADCAQDAPIKR